MQRKRSIFVLITMFVLLGSFSCVSAHELVANVPARRRKSSYSTHSNAVVLQIGEVETGLSSAMAQVKNASFNAWQNIATKNSVDWVNVFVSRTSRSANLAITSRAPSPSNYPLLSGGTFGETFIYSATQGYLIDPYTGAVNNTVNGTFYITMATIYISTSVDSLSSTDRQKILTHEIGHAVGLGHTPAAYSATSVMKQGLLSYYTPQAHDGSDIYMFYRY